MRNFVGGLIIGLVAGVVLAVVIPGGDRDMPKSGPLSPPDQAKSSLPEKIRWRMASAFGAEVVALGGIAKRTSDTAKTISKGDVELEFHGPGELVPTLDLFDAVASGTIEAAFASPVYWAEQEPALQLFGAIPFGPDAREYLAWFEFGGGKAHYEAAYRRHNMHGLLCGVVAPAGAGWFINPLRKPDDFKGLRIASLGLAAKVVGRLGATPVRLAANDLAGALKRREIDAAAFSVPTADVAIGLHEQASFYYFPAWFQQVALLDLMVHLPRWESLSDQQKVVIKTACDANLVRGLAETESGQFAVLKSLVLRGIKVERLTKEIMAALNSSWTSVVKQETEADPEFAKAWKDLAKFRIDYAIWRELGAL